MFLCVWLQISLWISVHTFDCSGWTAFLNTLTIAQHSRKLKKMIPYQQHVCLPKESCQEFALLCVCPGHPVVRSVCPPHGLRLLSPGETPEWSRLWVVAYVTTPRSKVTCVRLGSHLSATLHPEVGTRVTATPVEWGSGCPAESSPQLPELLQRMGRFWACAPISAWV